MATIITMPRLSDTMTEGTVATWLKKVGDKVSEGDILAEIETDKATMEFESFNEGTLLHIGIPAGETAPVDSLLAIIGKEGEDISALLAGKPADAAPAKEETKVTEETATTPEVTKAAAPATASLPKGVVVITMPRLSDTMTEGTVATWLKKVGDKVSEGDILAEIETDKATMEFESFNEGTLLYVGIEEGNTAPVDSLLAIIGPAGTDISGIAENYKTGGAPQAAPAVAEEKEVASTEKASEPIVQEPSTDGQRILASPLAKKIASDKGIQLTQVKGSGENGRIVKSDIENFTPQTSAAQAPTSAAPAKAETVAAAKPFVPAGEVFTEEIKNSQMRKIIAKRLAESLFTAPHYNLVIEVAMDEAMKSRTIINSVPDTKVSFNDMVIKACAMALKKHPKVNSQWSKYTTSTGLQKAHQTAWRTPSLTRPK